MSGEDLQFMVVEDEACPGCGSGFPNRPKVFDESGAWWRCYNDECPVSYYNPETGETE